jgi:hypothetical protein
MSWPYSRSHFDACRLLPGKVLLGEPRQPHRRRTSVTDGWARKPLARGVNRRLRRVVVGRRRLVRGRRGSTCEQGAWRLGPCHTDRYGSAEQSCTRSRSGSRRSLRHIETELERWVGENQLDDCPFCPENWPNLLVKPASSQGLVQPHRASRTWRICFRMASTCSLFFSNMRWRC